MHNQNHEAWTDATVAAILVLRTWAIRYGASPLKAWDMVSERARLASRRAETVEAWTSTIMRSLQIGTVDADASATIVALARVVGDEVDAWLDWVRDEHQFLFALAREQAEAKKAKQAKRKTAKRSPKEESDV